MEPEIKRRLTAAEGYLELGMYADCLEELSPLAEKVHGVLELRVEAHRGLHDWDAMRVAASKLSLRDPANLQWRISLAFAVRRAESLGAAREILLETLKLHPKEALVRYNLACYECQLGDLDAAREFLASAFTIAPGYRSVALEDPDLEPLKPEISTRNPRD